MYTSSVTNFFLIYYFILLFIKSATNLTHSQNHEKTRQAGNTKMRPLISLALKFNFLLFYLLSNDNIL